MYPLSYVSLNPVPLHLHPSSPVSCILYPLILYQQTGCSMVGAGQTFYLPLGVCSQPAPQGTPEKQSKFKPAPNTLQNH